MTNWEKYKDEIMEADNNSDVISWGEKHIDGFDKVESFLLRAKLFLDWCDDEYKEPDVDWSKVPVDTLCLVGIDAEDLVPRYFAGVDKDGIPTFFKGGRTSFTAKDKNDFAYWSYCKLWE